MKKITITKKDGQIGILTLADDGKYDIELNGKKGGSLHYTKDQVDRIINTARTDGSNITIE